MNGDMDEDALIAAADLVGRTGAREFEIGHTGDDDRPASEVTWYAHAKYQGERVTVEHYPHPVQAAEALARFLLDGGTCMSCGQPITLGGDGDSKCRWTRQARTWVKGCPDSTPQPARARLAQALGQIPHMPRDMIEKVAAGHYDEFTGPLDLPEIQLVADLEAIATRPPMKRDLRVGLQTLIGQIKNGEFDAGPEESAAWMASAEGQQAMAELVDMYKPAGHDDTKDGAGPDPKDQGADPA